MWTVSRAGPESAPAGLQETGRSLSPKPGGGLDALPHFKMICVQCRDMLGKGRTSLESAGADQLGRQWL